MNQFYRIVFAFVIAVVFLPASYHVAYAGNCQRLAATAIAVGKAQSTANAKEELSDYIVSYTSSRGIKYIRKNSVSVTCKDYIQLLNEFKCRAVRTFCW